jgi:hypothetical protein
VSEWIGGTLFYLAAALVGAAVGIGLCLRASLRIPRIQEDFGPLALVFYYLPLSLVAGGLGGAVLAVGLVFAGRRAGLTGLAGYSGALAAAALLAGLVRRAADAREANAWRDPGIAARHEERVRQHEAAMRALHAAARCGDAAGVEACLDGGTFLDSFSPHVSEYGETALMLAARAGHLGVVRLLLSRGAVADLANDRGETAGRLAELHGHAAVAALLARAEQPPSGPRGRSEEGGP